MLLLAMALLAPPILEFIFNKSCARVISLHNFAFLSWMHWVARPFFFSICRTLSSFISKLPFSVSQILLRSAVMKNKTLISSTLDLMRIFCWSDVNRGVSWEWSVRDNVRKNFFQYPSRSLFQIYKYGQKTSENAQPVNVLKH